MCAEILRTAGVSPTVVSGADLDSEGSFRRGDGDVLLFEACEYRDAFPSFCPTHALALGVSWEHPDYFPDKASVTRSFHAFLHGKTVTCSVAPAMSELSADIIFGHGGSVTAEAVTRAEEGHCFLLCRAGRAVGRVSLHVSGDFQIENALGAAALCHSLGIRDEDVVKGLSSYRGIPRRMEKCGTLRGVPLYLDFAHHPKELFCAMRTARGFGRPVAAVFEPHTYSRTKAFFEEYARVLRMPHMAGVLPIYAAREKDTGVVSSAMLSEKIPGCYLAKDFEDAKAHILESAKDGDIVMTVGAGDVFKIGEELLSELKK
jgi:UDP-N-acetylmuramate--alanine ligase